MQRVAEADWCARRTLTKSLVDYLALGKHVAAVSSPQNAGMVNNSIAATNEPHFLVCILGFGIGHGACIDQWDHSKYNAKRFNKHWHTGLTFLEHSSWNPAAMP